MSASVSFRLLAFGATREIVGAAESVSQHTLPLTVGGFKSWLLHKYPALSRLRSLTIAVNGTYVADDVLLKEGDEVALIPPVSGG
jgi:molybdopterin converting factor subunit 1